MSELFRKLVNYTKLNKDKIDNNEKMKKDIFEKFKWNIEHNDEDNDELDELEELDLNHLTNIYSNFRETVLLEGDIDDQADKELIEDIEFISQQLKEMATSVFSKIFS
jgi:uncharacterized protein YktB (UPF0637 family)